MSTSAIIQTTWRDASGNDAPIAGLSYAHTGTHPHNEASQGGAPTSSSKESMGGWNNTTTASQGGELHAAQAEGAYGDSNNIITNITTAPQCEDLQHWSVAAAVVTVQGGIVEVTRIPDAPRKKRVAPLLMERRDEVARRGGGRRGVIKGFSRGARRRMLKMLARLRDDVPTGFLALTLPDCAEHDAASVKRYLKRFRERFRRAHPNASFVWRIEWVARKSGGHLGEFYPHFHVLAFGVQVNKDFRSWLSLAWFECVGSDDAKHLKAGTNAQQARSGRSARAYASKMYAAKSAPVGVELPNIGRHYGIHNEAGLPWAEAHMQLLTARESVRVLRALRAYARASIRRRKGKAPKSVNGWRFTFIESADRWAALLASGALQGGG